MERLEFTRERRRHTMAMQEVFSVGPLRGYMTTDRVLLSE
jgi:hypothetical protein